LSGRRCDTEEILKSQNGKMRRCGEMEDAKVIFSTEPKYQKIPSTYTLA